MLSMEQDPQRNAQLLAFNLPDEILIEILTRLPVRSLLKFRCVCKSWNSLICSRSFINAHLDKSSADYILVMTHSTESLFSLYSAKTLTKYADVDPRSCGMDSSGFCLYFTCNGLLLIYSNGELFIWNPSIRKIKRLPQVLYETCKDSITRPVVICLGLGFHHQNKDYTVVRVIRLQKGMYRTELYSLRSNSWRDLAAVLPNSVDHGHLLPFGLYANGVFYWNVWGKASEGYSDSLLSFDMDTEVFDSIEIPEKLNGVDSRVRVFENSLSVIHMRQDGDHPHLLCYDIWVLRLDTWKMSRTILLPPQQYGPAGWPLSFAEDGVYIESWLDENREFRALVLYDPISRESKEITRVGKHQSWTIAETYRESLVLLN